MLHARIFTFRIQIKVETMSNRTDLHHLKGNQFIMFSGSFVKLGAFLRPVYQIYIPVSRGFFPSFISQLLHFMPR